MHKNFYEHMVPSPMHFDNTEPFLDHVGAMVNDVIVTNEVNVSDNKMQKFRHSMICFKLLRDFYGMTVVTKLNY